MNDASDRLQELEEILEAIGDDAEQEPVKAAVALVACSIGSLVQQQQHQ